MNLYDMDKAINDVLENGFSVDEETGEILFETTDLESLEISKEEKLENIGLFIKALDADAKAIKEEEQNLATRRKRKEAKAEYLRTYISNFMASIEQTSFETPRVSLSFRKSTQVEVDDFELPAKWFKKKITKAPDKTAIKKALQNGEKIQGAKIVTKNNLQLK